MKSFNFTHKIFKSMLVLLIAVVTVLGTQAAPYYPDMPVSGPTDQFPSNFVPFDISVMVTTAAANNGTPEISEWTRQNANGDTMALTGEGLGGDVVGFVFADGFGTVSDGLIQRLDGRLAAVTLPDSLTPDEMYLLWPINENGVGEPVGINQAAAWWIGPDVVWTGQTFAVYGENLDLGDGLCQIYIDGYGWVENNGTYNPYKVEFECPADLPVGLHTVYTHNGHGLKYGWSEPLSLRVRPAVVYEPDTNNWYNVMDYGAVGDGVTDDSAAISALRTAVGRARGRVMYFPAGTYLTATGVKVSNGQKLVGAGMDLTTIRCSPDFKATFSGNDAPVFMYSDGTVEDLTINTGNTGKNDFALAVVGASIRTNTTLNRIRFDTSRDDGGYYGSNLHIASADYVYINDCEFLIRSSVYDGAKTHHYYKGCEFIGVNDVNSLMASSPKYFVMEDCSAHSLSVASTVDNTWAKGRWVSGGDIQFAYFEGNVSSNMMPRNPEIEWIGEVLEIRESTNTYTYIYGTYPMLDIRVANTFQSVRLKGWPDSSFLQYDEFNREKKFAIGAMDYDSGWISVWSRYGLQGMIDSFTVGEWVGLRENTDANAGEQWMWESTPHLVRESPRSVPDASTVVFGVDVEKKYDDYLMVLEGRGMGQVVEIDYISGTTVYLAEPLRVLPDTDSVIQIGDSCHKLAFYNNNLNGYEDWDVRNTATCMISIYGSGTSVIADSNTGSEFDQGVLLFANPASAAYYQEPQLFNRIANNEISETRYGIGLLNTDFISSPVESGSTFFGNVVRGNVLLNNWKGIRYNTAGGDYQIDLNVLEGNTIEKCDVPLDTDDRLYNQVLLDNLLIGDGSSSAIIFDGAGQTPALRGNTYDNYPAAYGGGTPGAILELPIRYARLNSSATMEFPVWNSGTEPLIWNASCLDTWLELVQSTGTIADENSVGALIFRLASEPAAGSSALITISGGGDTKYIKVMYEEDGTIAVQALIGPSYQVSSELIGKTVTVSVVETLLKDDVEMPLPGTIPQIVEGSRCLFEENGELRLYISPTIFSLIPGRPYRWTLLERDGESEFEVASKIFFWEE